MSEEAVDVWAQVMALTSVLGDFRKALLAEGFSTEEAGRMCLQMMKAAGQVAQ